MAVGPTSGGSSWPNRVRAAGASASPSIARSRFPRATSATRILRRPDTTSTSSPGPRRSFTLTPHIGASGPRAAARIHCPATSSDRERTNGRGPSARRRAGDDMIEWDADARQFHLANGRLSYILAIHESGALGLLHLGAALTTGRSYRHLLPRPFAGFSNRLGDPVALEYPTPGSGDYRVPGLIVEQTDGSTVLELGYREHRIASGKPAIPGLPATYAEADDEAETLEIDLADEPSGLVVTLSYTIFRDVAAVARSARIRNDGPHSLRLATAMSLVLDLPDAAWDLVQLDGAWARERHVHTRRLEFGRQSISSSRGSSSAVHNPFVALRRASTTEAHGEAIGVALVYSANFLAEVEVEPFGSARLRIGIDPETFAWSLPPGAEFATPEAVIVHTPDGLGAMSDAFHRLFRERLAR